MSLEIQNRLRGLILEQLDRIAFAGPALAGDSWGTLERDLLNFCIDHEIVTLDKVAKVVSMRLSWLGQSSHSAMQRAGIKPSKVASPQLLAYFIRSGSLSDKQIGEISFENGENATTFCPEVGKDFIEEVITKLRT
jgi:hypothetical protein